MDEKNPEIENRKKKLVGFLKKKTTWIFYAILLVISAVSIYIRTLPMRIVNGNPGLWDITTNDWTLGPDLDPFLFLRWAKYIAENGKLFALDLMRSVPLAEICSGTECIPVDTSGEMNLLSYMVVWLNKFLQIFNPDSSVTYAAVIFPVIMAFLTGIAFFLFARKLFYKEDKKIANIIALISTAIFVLVPSLLPRTIAGIPEKESAAFFFIFLSLYFFLESFTSEKLGIGLIFGALAGISTGLLGLVWGGIDLIFVILSGAVMIELILGKIDRNKFFFYSAWLIAFILSASPFSLRYSISNLIQSTSSSLCFIVFFILLIDFLLFNKKNKMQEKFNKIKLPHQAISIILGLGLLLIISVIFFGFSFIFHIFEDIISNTIQPISQGRFSVTVAENKQSFFISDFTGSFGPIIFNIPLYFWLFFIGAIFMFNYAIKSLDKKEKRILTSSYILFLVCLIYSKYSSGSILNGTNILSLIVYFGGVLIFVGSLIYIYFKKYKEGKFSEFKELDSSYILYLIALTVAIIAARGAIRLIMVLGAVSPIAIGFLVIRSMTNYFKEKDDFKKLIVGIIALLILISSIFTIWIYYQSDVNLAENYIPSLYQWQWQGAMSWVRENTPTDAVFAHWWDYGYWLQSIGERATILDGGNAVGYWNYFMGRHVLTGTDEKEALNFLYTHNGTHLLIDSTDIGKYGAFSSIGSNGSYDRFSSIPTIFVDEAQTTETGNETRYVYPVGVSIDKDYLIKSEGKEILLPERKAGVIAILVREDKTNGKILQPQIFFGYNNQQYVMPLKSIYLDGKLYTFDSGFEGGIYIFPRLDLSSNNQFQINPRGAALYLGEKTINSQLAKLYLFNEQSNYFKLVHSENNLFIDNLKQQKLDLGDIVYYQGLQGPIKIWEISYPSNVKFNQDYLEQTIPAELETIIEGIY
jgi:asparagine N-glycosylation enzyme membrane subunit Stt3